MNQTSQMLYLNGAEFFKEQFAFKTDYFQRLQLAKMQSHQLMIFVILSHLVLDRFAFSSGKSAQNT